MRKGKEKSVPITLCLNEMHHPELHLLLCRLLLVATLSIHSDCGCSYTFDLNLRKNSSSSGWKYSVPVYKRRRKNPFRMVIFHSQSVLQQWIDLFCFSFQQAHWRNFKKWNCNINLFNLSLWHVHTNIHFISIIIHFTYFRS